ncbi:hypothetical protein HDU83_003204 [Entophlyctis luteolus]|nr:hypothetical protein HDU83_003204 [Entophlyctis luteolus]
MSSSYVSPAKHERARGRPMPPVDATRNVQQESHQIYIALNRQRSTTVVRPERVDSLGTVSAPSRYLRRQRSADAPQENNWDIIQRAHSERQAAASFRQLPLRQYHQQQQQQQYPDEAQLPLNNSHLLQYSASIASSGAVTIMEATSPQKPLFSEQFGKDTRNPPVRYSAFMTFGGRSSHSGDSSTKDGDVSPYTLHPSKMTLRAVLNGYDVIHGGILHRSSPILSSPKFPSDVPEEMLRKRGGGLFRGSKGLTACAIAYFGKTLYVFDVAGSGASPGPGPGPRLADGSLATPEAVHPQAPPNRLSFSSDGSAATVARDDYSRALLDARPAVALRLANASVAERGVAVIRVCGLDLLSGGGAFQDVYLQAADPDEMVAWVRVLKCLI